MKELIRSISLNRELAVETICYLKFGRVPESEIAILKKLLYLSVNNQLVLGIEESKSLREELGISQSLLSTCLHRMVGRNIIKKSGKTITLSPVFADVNTIDKLLIKFV